MSKRNDISQQIRKYLNGELDARVMNQLEKEALNDPFLMEALEGYEKNRTDQQSNIYDIHARLKARISKKEVRIIPWRIISIAASVLIALTIGGLWLKNNNPEPAHKQIAINATKAAKPNVKSVETKKVMPPPPYAPEPTLSHATQQKQPEAIVASTLPAEEYKAAPTTANGYLTETTPVKKDKLIDTSKLEKVVVVGYGNVQNKAIAANNATNPKPPNFTNGLTAKSSGLRADTSSAAVYFKQYIPSQPPANALAGRVAGITISKAPTKKVTGIVKDNGEPIPGVTIKIKGTNIGVVTDANGKFTLQSVPNGAILDLAFIGYEKKEIAINKRDSLVIAMQPNNNALSEVVVTSYGIQKEQEYQPAQPAAGWGDYKKYLKDNAMSPDGKTGTVKLSFIVNTDNSLSDFKIIKSVSAKTDSAAIDLVTNGPDWQKSNNGKAEKVKLRIKFTAKQ